MKNIGLDMSLILATLKLIGVPLTWKMVAFPCVIEVSFYIFIGIVAMTIFIWELILPNYTG